jgi:hypothetical protein
MSKRSLGIAWTLATGLVWAIAPLYLLNTSIQSLPEVLPLLVVYTLVGAGLGLAVGVLQGQILRVARLPVKSWWLDSLTGFALSFPVGLVISTLIPVVTWGAKGQPFLAAGSGMTYSPYPVSAIIAGFIVGLVQWRTLRPLFPKAGRKEAALWVMGTWLSVCLGAFIPRSSLTSPLLIIVSSILAGAASAGVLVILLVKKNTTVKPKSMAFVRTRHKRRSWGKNER